MKNILIITLILFTSKFVNAQCCSAGSGSPIGGGASQGVLQERQFEINTNFQFVNSKKFFTEDRPDTSFIDNYGSQYVYTRFAYGVTKNFTLSVESGYYIEKSQVELFNGDQVSSSGIADIIIFPRYDIINRTDENVRTELTVGLGIKIPVGEYNDSLTQIEPFSQMEYKIPKPLAVQPSSGAHDFIFYSFYNKGFPLSNFRVFANGLYVKKGWSPLGEKLGDYASIGLFASKTFMESLGATLQVKGEWVDKMKMFKGAYDMFLFPRTDPEATGSKKVFIVPQLSYNYKSLTLYALSEFPVYQYLTKTQIGSQYQTTVGVSYRAFIKKSNLKKKIKEKENKEE